MIPFLQRVEKSTLLVQLCADHEESADEGEPPPKELKFEWLDNENVESILSRFSVQLSQAAADLQGQTKASLHIEKVVNPSRSADSLDHEVLLQAVDMLHSYGLRAVLFKDSCEYITTSAGMEGLTALTTLDVTACGLTEVPEVLAALVNLQKLHLRRNKLTSLPPFIGFVMKQLTHLDADDNLITTLPESLQDLTNLNTLSLSNNRLKVPIVNLSKLNKLYVLHLGGNPLQYFPELSQAPSLLTVSLANLLIVAEPSWTSWTVEMLNQRTSRLSMRANTSTTVNETLRLLLSRSSAQHPLIAGGLAEMAADEDHRSAMLKTEGLLPQLVYAMMSENMIVAAKSCETLCKLTTTKDVALDVEKAGAISAAHKLVLSSNDQLKKCGLAVLNELAFASEDVACRILRSTEASSSSDLLADLMATVQQSEPAVQCSALLTISTLAFPGANKLRMLEAEGCVALFKDLAATKHDTESEEAKVRMAALRVLSVLGQNDFVDSANGKRPIQGRGLRVLALDGGGMKGMTEVTILRELEKRTGKRVHELFDVIGGTSTGCMLAVACGIMRFTLDQMEEVYMDLGTRIFAASSKDAPPATVSQELGTPSTQSWSEGLMRLYRSGEQGMRVAMYGAKHNTPLFEQLLQEQTNLQSLGTLNDMTIDANCLSGPKVFRTYEFAPSTDHAERAERLALHRGSSKHKLWQAIRASSAAPYYLDDFRIGEERFIDGAVSVNNPSVVAVQEARMLYPGHKIDCFMSLGVGVDVSVPRPRGVSTYFETGSAVIEGASNISRPHEALSSMLDMAGCVYERFCPVDARCGIPLDCTDDKLIQGLVKATEEYIDANSDRLQRMADMLMQSPEETQEDKISVPRHVAEKPLHPKGTRTLALAAPVTGTSMEGQLVSALQGLHHAAILDLKHLTKSPCQADGSVVDSELRVVSSKAQNSAEFELPPTLLTHSMADSANDAQLLSWGEHAASVKGHGRLRLTVPCVDDTGTKAHSPHTNDSQFITPTADGLKSTNDESPETLHPLNNVTDRDSIHSHAIRRESIGGGDTTQASTSAGSPQTSVPPVTTFYSQRDRTSPCACEEIPAVQEMVHDCGENRETSAADHSPSSGLLGMLVSMVSTSMSPKRDKSSSHLQSTDPNVQVASPMGTSSPAKETSSTGGGDAVADDTVDTTNACAAEMTPSNTNTVMSPQGSPPFDDRLYETPKSQVDASPAGAHQHDAGVACVTQHVHEGHSTSNLQPKIRDPAAMLHDAQDIGFVVVAAHFVDDGVVAKFSESLSTIVEGTEAAQKLYERLYGAPHTDRSSFQDTCSSAPIRRLGEIEEPLQTLDSTGVWYKCLLQQSHSMASPGLHAPSQLNTLLMQEFRPESIWPVQQLQGVLRNMAAVVVLPPVPRHVVDLVLSCGSLACVVAKSRTEKRWSTDMTTEAALCAAQVIEEVRSGHSLQAAMLQSGADRFFDVVMP